MPIPTAVKFLPTLFMVGAAAAQATLVVPTGQPTIQAAIGAAANGDTVLVLPGTYVETIDLLGKSITVRSAGGAAVTTIDGNQAGPVVTFANNEPATCVLDGFTITGGLGLTVSGVGARATAGGIQCVGASPTIRHCVVTGNQGGAGVAATSGSSLPGTGGPGGILAVTSALRLVDCDVQGNVGGAGGAGISGLFSLGARGGAGGAYLAFSVLGTTAAVVRCRFTANEGGAGGGVVSTGQAATAGNGGTGGIELFSAVPVVLTDVVVAGNQGGGGGTPVGSTTPTGGVGGTGGFDLNAPFLGVASVAMTNCVVASNVGGNAGAGGTAHGGDGGGSTGGTTFTALSTTVAGNRAGTPLLVGTGTGGLLLGGFMTSSAALRNCIAWGNTRGGVPSDLTAVGIPMTLEASDVGASTGTFLGAGNLGVDPLFVDLAAGDLHLTAASPCRDVGASGAGLPLFDLDGDPRTIGSGTDMGADEFEVFAGSREDFALGLDVNGAFSPSIGATFAFGGDVVTVRTTSPGGTLANVFALLVVEPWLPPNQPAGPPGLPELHVPFGAIWLDVHLAGVGPAGATLSVPWPPGLAGFALRLQAVALTPSAKNGVFVASAARDLIL